MTHIRVCSRSRVAISALIACCALLVSPVGARAAQAPGAPGERHTWAPADKHAFGTATRLASNVWFTLRAAELTEIYYPDLSTPSFRDLEFVVSDGKTFIDRETGPGVRSEVRPLPGSLTFRQTTQTARWRLVKTWITDPERATVLADVRFESLTGRPLELYVLADPAPGDDGDDDRAGDQGSALVAWDDTAASAVVAEPDLRRPTSGYAGSASDPWRDLEADMSLDRSLQPRPRPATWSRPRVRSSPVVAATGS